MLPKTAEKMAQLYSIRMRSNLTFLVIDFAMNDFNFGLQFLGPEDGFTATLYCFFIEHNVHTSIVRT
jgi:hypothetical protein